MCRPRGERPAGLPPCRARAQPGYQVFAGFLETLVFSNYYGNTFCFVLFLKFLMDAGTATLLHFVPSDNIGEQKGPSTGLCCSSPGARGSEVSGDTRGCPGVEGLERRAVLPAAGARGRRGCAWLWNTGSPPGAGPAPARAVPAGHGSAGARSQSGLVRVGQTGAGPRAGWGWGQQIVTPRAAPLPPQSGPRAVPRSPRKRGTPLLLLVQDLSWKIVHFGIKA